MPAPRIGFTAPSGSAVAGTETDSNKQMSSARMPQQQSNPPASTSESVDAGPRAEKVSDHHRYQRQVRQDLGGEGTLMSVEITRASGASNSKGRRGETSPARERGSKRVGRA